MEAIKKLVDFIADEEGPTLVFLEAPRGYGKTFAMLVASERLLKHGVLSAYIPWSDFSEKRIVHSLSDYIKNYGEKIKLARYDKIHRILDHADLEAVLELLSFAEKRFALFIDDFVLPEEKEAHLSNLYKLASSIREIVNKTPSGTLGGIAIAMHRALSDAEKNILSEAGTLSRFYIKRILKDDFTASDGKSLEEYAARYFGSENVAKEIFKTLATRLGLRTAQRFAHKYLCSKQSSGEGKHELSRKIAEAIRDIFVKEGLRAELERPAGVGRDDVYICGKHIDVKVTEDSAYIEKSIEEDRKKRINIDLYVVVGVNKQAPNIVSVPVQVGKLVDALVAAADVNEQKEQVFKIAAGVIAEQIKEQLAERVCPSVTREDNMKKLEQALERFCKTAGASITASDALRKSELKAIIEQIAYLTGARKPTTWEEVVELFNTAIKAFVERGRQSPVVVRHKARGARLECVT
ncbi:MAG: hypothetical protein QXI84_10905 [Thermofilaceae archaeon]